MAVSLGWLPVAVPCPPFCLIWAFVKATAGEVDGPSPALRPDAPQLVPWRSSHGSLARNVPQPPARGRGRREGKEKRPL